MKLLYASHDHDDALTPQEKERLVQTMLARLNRQAVVTSKQSIHTLTVEIRKQISEIEGGPSCQGEHK